MTRIAELVLPRDLGVVRVDRYRGLYRVAYYLRHTRNAAQHESLHAALAIVFGELDVDVDPEPVARVVGPMLPRPYRTHPWDELEPLPAAELEQVLDAAQADHEGRLFTPGPEAGRRPKKPEVVDP